MRQQPSQQLLGATEKELSHHPRFALHYCVLLSPQCLPESATLLSLKQSPVMALLSNIGVASDSDLSLSGGAKQGMDPMQLVPSSSPTSGSQALYNYLLPSAPSNALLDLLVHWPAHCTTLIITHLKVKYGCKSFSSEQYTHCISAK